MKGYDENSGARNARLWFGIFMVVIYIGVGICFCVDFFNIDNTAISATVGGILCAYGVWRAYRLYRGDR